MDIIERNTDVLHHDLEVITRVLGKVAIVLSLICCAIYASPGAARATPAPTADTVWMASTGVAT